MKSLIKFLEQNSINYKIVSYGNFLYIPAEPIQGIFLELDHETELEKINQIEKYLKAHKKLYFENHNIVSKYYFESTYKIFNRQQYNEFLNTSNFDKKLIDKFNYIYHCKGLEAANKFYIETMNKYQPETVTA